jgi:hypothetical protein
VISSAVGFVPVHVASICCPLNRLIQCEKRASRWPADVSEAVLVETTSNANELGHTLQIRQTIDIFGDHATILAPHH